MDLNPDFQDLIKSLLTDHNVEFLIVGAHALAFHGVARYTQDLGSMDAKDGGKCAQAPTCTLRLWPSTARLCRY